MTEPDVQDYLATDYFDDIKPSLLNSDDIHRYASIGWLVTEYDKRQLLPAGYRLRFLGDLIFWKRTQGGEYQREQVEVIVGQPITLFHNSIAYLHMKEKFRLPQYIAARFNLRISHVHQGLLLGTGPIVDPGFCGRLLVPLHNLTANDYLFMGGESFIHVEFTKLSPLRRWEKDVDPDAISDNYVAFPQDKISENSNYYFEKARVLEKRSVVSNLTYLAAEVDSALSEIKALGDDVERKQKVFNWIGFGGIATLLVLIFTVFSILRDAYGIWHRVDERAAITEATLIEAREIMDEMSAVALDGSAIVDPDDDAEPVNDTEGLEGLP